MNPKNDPEECHAWRHRIFRTYQDMGLDAALDLLNGSKLPKIVMKGLGAELLFYDEYKDSKRLEPSLDAGTKTDFYGIENGKPMHYDVTTCLHYKDPNAYLPMLKKSNYTIALAENLQRRKFGFYPLKFPICPECERIAHYILYLVPSVSQFYQNIPVTDDQRILIYCTCGYDKELQDFNYIVGLPFDLAEERSHEQRDEESRDPTFNFTNFVRKESIPVVQFFEKESQKLISALVQNEYVFTDKDGGGFWQGRICWKHPLIKDLTDAIDLYYGEWLK